MDCDNGPGRAPEILQGENHQIKTPGTDMSAGMGKSTEMQVEKTESQDFVDPLAPVQNVTAEGKYTGEITLKMLPDQDLIKIAKSQLTKEKMPKPDKTTGQYDRDALIAALEAAGITGVENE